MTAPREQGAGLDGVVEAEAVKRAVNRIRIAASEAMRAISEAAPQGWGCGGAGSVEFVRAVASTLTHMHIGARADSLHNPIGSAMTQAGVGPPPSMVEHERKRLLEGFGEALSKAVRP